MLNKIWREVQSEFKTAVGAIRLFVDAALEVALKEFSKKEGYRETGVQLATKK